MTVHNIFYRAWQFWQSLTGSLSQQDWDEVRAVLSPDQLDLFAEMPDPEQSHGLRVLRTLKSGGHRDPDLLAAGLLHDVGKSRHPLNVWDRVWIVLAESVFSPRSNAEGSHFGEHGEHLIAVAERHPEWGAKMALEQGSSPVTVWLIRNHERRGLEDMEDSCRLRLLKALIKADNRS